MSLFRSLPPPFGTEREGSLLLAEGIEREDDDVAPRRQEVLSLSTVFGEEWGESEWTVYSRERERERGRKREREVGSEREVQRQRGANTPTVVSLSPSLSLPATFRLSDPTAPAVATRRATAQVAAAAAIASTLSTTQQPTVERNGIVDVSPPPSPNRTDLTTPLPPPLSSFTNTLGHSLPLALRLATKAETPAQPTSPNEPDAQHRFAALAAQLRTAESEARTVVAERARTAALQVASQQQQASESLRAAAAAARAARAAAVADGAGSDSSDSSPPPSPRRAAPPRSTATSLSFDPSLASTTVASLSTPYDSPLLTQRPATLTHGRPAALPGQEKQSTTARESTTNDGDERRYENASEFLAALAGQR